MNKTERPRLPWDITALKLAFDIAEYRSPDPYVQVGAAIIKTDNSIILGYNGAPPKIEIDWSNRDERRKRVIHAEENALSEVKYGEVKLMAVTALPCANCLKTAAKKGVKTIIYNQILDNYDNNLTFKLAEEFGINLKQLNI